MWPKVSLGICLGMFAIWRDSLCAPQKTPFGAISPELWPPPRQPLIAGFSLTRSAFRIPNSAFGGPRHPLARSDERELQADPIRARRVRPLRRVLATCEVLRGLAYSAACSRMLSELAPVITTTLSLIPDMKFCSLLSTFTFLRRSSVSRDYRARSLPSKQIVTNPAARRLTRRCDSRCPPTISVSSTNERGQSAILAP
jgi:hypothetical protein